jgi:hypothetical protein
MGPVGGLDSFTSTRPPRFGDPSKEDYPSYRRDVELWLKLTEVVPVKQGVALVGCLSGEPKEFAKTMPDDLLFSDDSGKNVLMHLDKAYQNSLEMILNSRVSAFLDYQRLPSMSISTYIAGFYARLDNLSQLQMPDELKGHLLLKQANLESDQKSMIIASARGSYKSEGCGRFYAAIVRGEAGYPKNRPGYDDQLHLCDVSTEEVLHLLQKEKSCGGGLLVEAQNVGWR